MKTTTFVAAFCCFTFLSSAETSKNHETPAFDIGFSDDSKRALVATIEGVEVYYSSSENSGNTLLDIRFVNTSNESITFSWKVEKDGMVHRGQKQITLKPGEAFNVNSALEVKGTSDLTKYSIELITNN